jgi:hypothetical protein
MVLGCKRADRRQEASRRCPSLEPRQEPSLADARVAGEQEESARTAGNLADAHLRELEHLVAADENRANDRPTTRVDIAFQSTGLQWAIWGIPDGVRCR